MSSTELDLPLLPSSDQIRRREFATIRRGYDPDQVREYLQQIASQVETLERQLGEARLHAASGDQVVTLSEQTPADDPYERLAGRLSDVLRAADDQAERILQDAREEAAMILVEARTEADRIRVDAQAHAEEARQEGGEVLKNARLEAERMLSGLSARRETLVDQLQQMQSRLIGVAQELEAAIDEPPGSDEEEAETPQPATREFDLLEGAAGEPTIEAADLDDPIDPRYEDLWVAPDTMALDLGDLSLGEDDPKEE